MLPRGVHSGAELCRQAGELESMIAGRSGEQEGVGGEFEEWAGGEVRTVALECAEFGVQFVEIPFRRDAVEHESAGPCPIADGERSGHWLTLRAHPQRLHHTVIQGDLAQLAPDAAVELVQLDIYLGSRWPD